VWSEEAGATEFMRVVSNDAMAGCLKDIIGPSVKDSLQKNKTSYDKLEIEVGRESSAPAGDEQVSYQAKLTVLKGSASESVYVDYQLPAVLRGVLPGWQRRCARSAGNSRMEALSSARDPNSGSAPRWAHQW
jgi:hypothetical protein